MVLSRGLVRRPIPSTGELLPGMGLGTYLVFDAGLSRSERDPLREVLDIFSEQGGGIVDTSPMYGSAEAVVGELVRELGIRDKLFLATKVWTAGKRAGAEQMERSFALLQTDTIDLMQVHNLVDWENHIDTIRSWQDRGRVRYCGVTHYSVGAFEVIERIMKAARPDFIQIHYSILNREAEERILPLAADLGIAVIANRPLEEKELFSMVRGKTLPPWAAEFGCSSWAQYFLKFVLSHPAVTSVIAGTSNPEHLRDNLRSGFGPLPDEATRIRMSSYLYSLLAAA